jgi:hypothetical protein
MHNDVLGEALDDSLRVVHIPGVEPLLCHRESLCARHLRSLHLGKPPMVEGSHGSTTIGGERIAVGYILQESGEHPGDAAEPNGTAAASRGVDQPVAW